MVLCIAIGNPLRGDDGVALHALRLISPRPGLRLIETHQLLPELAVHIATAETVCFLDADPNCSEATLVEMELEPAGKPEPARAITLAHHLSIADVLTLAIRLYGFSGQAFQCHIPAKQLEHGSKLSLYAEKAACQAAKIINERIEGL